jgi:hypothetical protein
MHDLRDLSSAELRLELAEAEADRPKSQVGFTRKKNRIAAITRELCQRGAF